MILKAPIELDVAFSARPKGTHILYQGVMP
jgi:hypothetical protein